MKKRFISIVLSFMVILMCVPTNTPVNANSGTNVSGLIDQDTAWTAAGSPYSLSGNIHIANGVTLTVEPGVTIEGNGRDLLVYGDLEAVGRSDSKITFNNVNIKPGLTDYSYSTNTILIHIENADISKGSLKGCGYSSYGNLILRDSKLFNLDATVNVCNAQSDLFIERNLFSNTNGIDIAQNKNIAINISKNVFTNSRGILINTYADSKISILNNVFYHYNEYAVRTYSIRSSEYNSEVNVSFNSILTPKDQNTTALIIDKYSTAKITATNNYWGTTNESEIEKMIHDKIDNPSIGTYINFKPYLQSPDPNTPYLDFVKPIISGATDATIKVNSKFVPMLGVFANDNDDGDITRKVVVSGYIDNKKPGRYTLTYTVEDITGNISSVTRIITVVDDIKPVLVGVEDITLSVTSNNAGYHMFGVYATDNLDGYITWKIKVSGSVNFNKIGIYKLTYTVSDTSGNVTTKIRRITVIDKVKPVISGATNKIIKLKSTFNPKTGVTAKDNVDGNLTSTIKITGTVNTRKKGLYTLTYTVADRSKNKVVVTRKIIVR